MSLPLLVLALAAAGPRVAVVVHTTGFADDDAKHVQDKASQEVAATGVELWALSKALEVKTECLTDHACAKEIIRTADATYLVWVEALRAGGQVELEAHLLDTEGRSIAQDESAARADDVINAGAAVISSVVLAPLRSASKSGASSTTSTPPTSSSAATSTANTGGAAATAAPLTPEGGGAVAGEPKAAAPLSPLAIGGITALGGGALLAIGGGALAVSQLHVISDPASLGADKESAANTATFMFVAAGLGVAVAGVGGALLYLGM